MRQSEREAKRNAFFRSLRNHQRVDAKTLQDRHGINHDTVEKWLKEAGFHSNVVGTWERK